MWKTNYNDTHADFAVINAIDRTVEYGNTYTWWMSRQFRGFSFLIETTVSLSSRIDFVGNMDGGVDGSEVLTLPGRSPIDCWIVVFHNPYLDGVQMWGWFDKATGLLVKLDFSDPFGYDSEALLTDTNIPTEHADIAAKDIMSSKTVIGQGYNTVINVTVENHGAFQESVNVSIYGNATYIGGETVDLAVLESKQLLIVWNTTGFAKGKYALSVCLQPTPNETDVSDNNLTLTDSLFVTIAGDVTGFGGSADGRSDIRDITALILKFYAKPGDANWNPNYDVNDDGVVNLRDITLAILNFNKT
jgi:hypothetical protein